MTQTPYIVGNWKMNGSLEQSRALIIAIGNAVQQNEPNANVVVCPPATLLARLSDISEDEIALGGQDCHAAESGAYTGDVSAEMLQDSGATYVIVGHSERREYHGESNADVCAKAKAAMREGLTPIICVGESLADQESDRTLTVIAEQVLESLPEGWTENIIIAYEPVWAIGTGKIPTLDDINRVHASILAVLYKVRGIAADDASVLYGGSVKGSNAKDILSIESVGGVLVGGASLKAEEFIAIIDATL